MRRTYIRRQCGNTVRVPKKAAEESYINFWLVQPLSSSMLLLWLRWAPTKKYEEKKYSSNREEPHNFITISYYGWNCLFYCKHIFFMEFFLEGSAPLRIWKFDSEKKICICYSFPKWSNFSKDKLSIKAPVKGRKSVYLLMEIWA